MLNDHVQNKGWKLSLNLSIDFGLIWSIEDKFLFKNQGLIWSLKLKPKYYFWNYISSDKD